MDIQDPSSTVISVTGLPEIIKNAFKKVFDEINIKSEVWYQKSKLMSIGREKYTSYIINNVGAFELFAAGRSTSLDCAYVNVNVSKDVQREKYRSIKEIEEEVIRGASCGTKKDKNNISPLQAIEDSQFDFALIGSPGSGKTTAFRWIALQVSKGHKIKNKQLIPFYIAVRDMDKINNYSIKKTCVGILCNFDIVYAEKVFEKLLIAKSVLLLVDGLDEVKNEYQKRIISELIRLRKRYPGNVYCVSSRPQSLSVALDGFNKWETQPLENEEKINFIKKWFSEIAPQKGESFIKKCKHDKNLLRLADNPLILSLLCALYHNDLEIPRDQASMFERVISGLLGGWDAFRAIERDSVFAGISIPERFFMLEWIAHALYSERKIVFTLKDIENTNIYKKLINYMNIKLPDIDAIVKAYYNDFGIFVERAYGLYSFWHLSLQEYLVARYIVSNRIENELVEERQINHDLLNMVARVMKPADKLVKNLMEKARVDWRYVFALVSIMSVKPICSQELRIAAFELLYNKLINVLDKFRITVHLENNKVIYVDSQVYNRDIRDIDYKDRESFSLLIESTKIFVLYSELHYERIYKDAILKYISVVGIDKISWILTPEYNYKRLHAVE